MENNVLSYGFIHVQLNHLNCVFLALKWLHFLTFFILFFIHFSCFFIGTEKNKSEEDGAEQAGKKERISYKNDTSGLQVVEEEREALMTGREEQRLEDERETQQDQFVLETEQVRSINSSQERRINLSVEQKTQNMTGREEEQKETQQNDHKKPKQETDQRRNTNSSGTKTTALTETEPQFEMKQETHEEQSRRGRHDTHNMDIRGEQRKKDELKMSRTEEDRMNQYILAENVSQSVTEDEVNNLCSLFMAQKLT